MYQAHHLVTDLRGGRIVRISPDKVETTRQIRITEQNGQIVVTEDNRCLGGSNLVPVIPTARKRLSKPSGLAVIQLYGRSRSTHTARPFRRWVHARSVVGSAVQTPPRSHQMTTAVQVPELGPPLFMWAVDASHHRSFS